MKRRELLVGFGGVLAAWPPTSRAQQPAGPVIGFLGGADPVGYAVLVEALRSGLRDYGYVEGQKFRIEYRWAQGQYERLPALAADLVERKVDIIITQGTPAALAAKKATTRIPIVMAIVGNPVETGVVASLARPAGNVTGSSFFWAEVNAKRLEFMKNLNPGLAQAGVLMNPDNPAMTPILRVMEERARALDVKLQPVNVRRIDDLEATIEFARGQIEALTVVDDGLFIANARRIADLAARYRLPSIGFREYSDAGGMVAYGVDFPHIWRRAAVFVDKILKGAKPENLPIEQATKFELVVNLKTARALGITIPQPILLRADEVIE